MANQFVPTDADLLRRADDYPMDIVDALVAEVRRLNFGWEAEWRNSLAQAEGHEVMTRHLQDAAYRRQYEIMRRETEQALLHAAILRSERDTARAQLDTARAQLRGDFP